MFNDYAVRIRVINRAGFLKTIEKSFATEQARERWLTKAEAKSNFIEVVACSNPQEAAYV